MTNSIIPYFLHICRAYVQLDIADIYAYIELKAEQLN